MQNGIGHRPTQKSSGISGKADHEGWFAALYPRTLVLPVPIRKNLASQREGNLLCLCIGLYKNGLQELLGTIHGSVAHLSADENGKAIHEDCYVSRITSSSSNLAYAVVPINFTLHDYPPFSPSEGTSSHGRPLGKSVALSAST